MSAPILLSNVNADCLVYTRRQLVSVFSGKYFGIYNDTVLTMRYLQGSITHFTCLLTKDCAEQTLLCGQLGLSLRSYLTYQNITGTNLCTDTDDTSVIQILQCIITNSRNISGDLFRSKLGITGFCLIFLNMNGCINIIHNQSFT